MKKKIEKGNFTQIGFIKKTHAIKGELLVVYDKGLDEILEETDFLFFEIEGLLVPFPILEIDFRGDDTASFLFELIGSKEKAAGFVGCRVFIDNQLLIKNHEKAGASYLKGFSVIDPIIGEAGIISEIHDYRGNIVATVVFGEKEVLLPLNDKLIISVDKKQKTITVEYPEGLYDLN
ncbi:MAG: hypothetical protein JW798_08200 [Prolixibacteraceae bacterium]|nr:hypothetical protein [Prolixibacteraceae bacterium]